MKTNNIIFMTIKHIKSLHHLLLVIVVKKNLKNYKYNYKKT